MRVAFDEQIFTLQAYGGISRMFAELTQQFLIEEDLDVHLLPLNAPIINRYALDHDIVRERLAVWDARHEYYALTRYFMKFRARKHQDIVHNTFYLPHGLAAYPGAKRVVTVHDMIPELLPGTRRRLDFLTLKRHYVKRADHIICVSEATKSDLLTVYPDITAPISVIHHGVGSHFTPNAPRLDFLPQDYILFVGNRGSYKDAAVLFSAFARVTSHMPHLRLVLVGGGELNDSEKRRLADLKILDQTMQVDLSDDSMVSAYAHARLFVFPSRFEGFGIPALEAMASGTPTLLARSTSLPEVGGEAAQYFVPGDADDLARTMIETLNDRSLLERMRSLGLARAAEFTWHRAASQHAAAYRSILVS